MTINTDIYSKKDGSVVKINKRKKKYETTIKGVQNENVVG